MLTDQEMLAIAERYLKKSKELGGTKLEIVILHEETIKKPYGNIYYCQSKEFLLTRDFNKVLTGNPPFLVEKNTGRVVSFGTRMRLENYLQAYENGTMSTASNTYWYPDEDRFSSK
ncbi:YrhB domain-containing protein [Chryseobacterium sp. RLHN22]|uniref:YrhB domain-containing protein n=1 Tax=Chryseobacterium sp. RLHN22 TaxID=3437885 RepID=UPI003D9AD5B1